MEIAKNEIFDRVIKIVSSRTGRLPTEFSSETRILQDLKICGDDVESILEDLEIEFGISFAGFDFALYFPPEISFVKIFDRFYIPVTIADLCLAAETKKFPDLSSRPKVWVW